MIPPGKNAEIVPLPNRELTVRRSDVLIARGLADVAGQQPSQPQPNQEPELSTVTIPLPGALYQRKSVPQFWDDGWSKTASTPATVRISADHTFKLELEKANDAELGCLKSLPNLTELGVEDCGSVTDLVGCDQITDASVAHLACLTQLEDLSLTSTKISDAGLAHLSSLSQLRELSLVGCDQITDAGLAHLSSLSQLRELHVRAAREEVGHGPLRSRRD